MENTLTEALEREHDEIDDGLVAFAAALEAGTFREDELARAARALRRHIYLEEEFLFPPLRAAGMLAPVLVMLKEHGEIWRTLDALEEEAARLRETDGGRSGEGAPADPASGGGRPLAGSQATADHCHDLLEILSEHNAKEEPIIYPQGDVVLSPDVKQDLHDFILEGSMPDGWVCEQV